MRAQKQVIGKLLAQVETLHEEMLRLEKEALPAELNPAHADGARNLLHYVALRRHDIRELQQDLAALGFSSLGRTESHVLGTIRAVLHSLRRLDGHADRLPQGRDHESRDHESRDHDLNDGKRLLECNTEALLGPAPEGRRVRIMVTMPSEAATDYELVRRLVSEGMNCMRVNCAHDDATAWGAMIANLRRAEKELGKSCKVEMDLAGPKLRTGPMAPGPAVTKIRPQRDPFGKVVQPARVWLTATERPEKAPVPADASLPVSGRWLAQLQAGASIRFVDTRGAKRSMVVRERTATGCWAESDRTAYFTPGVVLSAKGASGGVTRGRVGPLPGKPQTLLMHPGDRLILTREVRPGQPAFPGDATKQATPASISVTLPEFFDSVKPNEPIWFDDGNIGGVITAVKPGEVTVSVVYAPAHGQKLGAEKGINVPETDLRIGSLTEEDRKNLAFAGRHADIIGLSFVRTAADVREVRKALAELGQQHQAIILKIETRAGFENLPQLLMEAMRNRAVGVMIARGDLAVECGFQRLAELQEEILWIAEAAHVPVVWATQVLESLAKTGKPSRSEITDAAMGERAECVMLNKGPYVDEAVRVLDDILARMQEHQEKKTSMLRKLNVATAFAGGQQGAA